jgi:uncharacterized protein with ParB-like and HNH nuclease domain
MNGRSRIEIALEALGHILGDRYLEVPVHQRSYAWETQHVTDLLQDLTAAIDNREEEYFLRTIVASEGNGERRVILDGQQRLATTTILLAAIRDYFLEIKDSDRADTIEQQYLLKKSLRTQERVPKLRLNQIDNNFFDKVVLSRPGSQERIATPERDSHERIKWAYQLAVEHISHLTRACLQTWVG